MGGIFGGLDWITVGGGGERSYEKFSGYLESSSFGSIFRSILVKYRLLPIERRHSEDYYQAEKNSHRSKVVCTSASERQPEHIAQLSRVENFHIQRVSYATYYSQVFTNPSYQSGCILGNPQRTYEKIKIKII